MAAAAPSDPRMCSNGVCPCRRTRKELDTAKEQRVNAYKQVNLGQKPPPNELHELFPHDGVEIVFHSADAQAWVCMDCRHMINVHPEGSPGRDEVSAIADQRARAVAAEVVIGLGRGSRRPSAAASDSSLSEVSDAPPSSEARSVHSSAGITPFSSEGVAQCTTCAEMKRCRLKHEVSCPPGYLVCNECVRQGKCPQCKSGFMV